MFFKLLCLCFFINVSAAEDVFEALYKAQGSNRLTACLREHSCAGIAWKQRWMLARASCVFRYHADSIYVKSGVFICTNDISTSATIETGNLYTRRAIARYQHPAYPELDLAILLLDYPYASTDMVYNATINANILNIMDAWVKNILFTESLRTIKPVAYRHHLKMYSTPMKMFLVTVVLPSTAFIVFFMFIVFFTGKNKGKQIPYQSLNTDKKETTYV